MSPNLRNLREIDDSYNSGLTVTVPTDADDTNGDDDTLPDRRFLDQITAEYIEYAAAYNARRTTDESTVALTGSNADPNHSDGSEMEANVAPSTSDNHDGSDAQLRQSNGQAQQAHETENPAAPGPSSEPKDQPK